MIAFSARVAIPYIVCTDNDGDDDDGEDDEDNEYEDDDDCLFARVATPWYMVCPHNDQSHNELASAQCLRGSHSSATFAEFPIFVPNHPTVPAGHC